MFQTWNYKLLEENIGFNLIVVGLGDDFLYLTSKAKGTKAKINKWDYIKLKTFFREFPGGLVVRIWHFTAVAQVQSLVGELRSHKPHGMANNNNNKK